MFMSSCTFFVFLSLIEYAFVNVMMGDIRYYTHHATWSHDLILIFSEIERKDRGNHMKNLVNHHKFLKNSVNLCASNQVRNKIYRYFNVYIVLIFSISLDTNTNADCCKIYNLISTGRRKFSPYQLSLKDFWFDL